MTDPPPDAGPPAARATFLVRVCRCDHELHVELCDLRGGGRRVHRDWESLLLDLRERAGRERLK